MSTLQLASQSRVPNKSTLQPSLPTRVEFMNNLANLRVADGQKVDGKCGGCNLPLASRSTDNTTDTVLVFHCHHQVGERCARVFLKDRSGCPECKDILFSEQPSCEDYINLRRIGYLQHAHRDYAEKGDRMMASKVKKLSQWLIDDCSDAFLSNATTVVPADYGLYREIYQLDWERLCLRARYVDAGKLIPSLNALWERMFERASCGAMLDWLEERKPGSSEGLDAQVKAPCHPLAARLRRQMNEILTWNDGQRCDVLQLRDNFYRVFVDSTLWKQLTELDSFNASPHGFFNYQRQLVQSVMWNFNRLPLAPRELGDDDDDFYFDHEESKVLSASAKDTQSKRMTSGPGRSNGRSSGPLSGQTSSVEPTLTPPPAGTMPIPIPRQPIRNTYRKPWHNKL